MAKLKKMAVKSAARIKQLWYQAEQSAAMGKPVEEERALRTILDMAPDHYSSLLKLSNMALQAGKMPIALDYAKRAVQARPDGANGHMMLGLVLTELGLTDLAEAELIVAEQINPKNAHILDALAWVLVQLGRGEEAVILFRRAIALMPNASSIYYHLASNKKFQPGDSDIELIKKLPDQLNVFSQDDKIYFHFALAKVYHDCEEYDQAFSEMQQANALRRAQVQSSSEVQEHVTDLMIQTMNADFVTRLSDAGHAEDSPVFVLGMARSGTTLVETLLCRHPQVRGIGEVPYVHNLAESCAQRLGGRLPYPQCLTELSLLDCQKLGEGYVQLSKQFGVNATRIVDKTPGNFLLIGFILAILPNAQIIHCVRNPMDTCLSIYQQFFTNGMNYSYDQKEVGEHYVQYQRLMDHWQKLFPGRILKVAYEDVVADSEKAQRRMMEHCGVAWDDRCLQLPGEDARIRTASAWQARQPIHSSSVQRWRHYEKHLGPLMEALKSVLTEGDY